MKPCPISCPEYEFGGLCKHIYPDSRTHDPKKNLVEDIMKIIGKHTDGIWDEDIDIIGEDVQIADGVDMKAIRQDLKRLVDSL